MDRWDGELYAAHAAHHRAHDAEFLDSLSLSGDERVVDIGCGVGDFTKKIALLVLRGSVIGVDASRSMLRVAERWATANLSFVNVAAQELDLAFPAAHFDLVTSRATLHWIAEADHAAMLASIRKCMRPNGRFRAEFGGAGNLRRLRAILDEESLKSAGRTCSWFLPDPDAYRELLERAGFACRLVRLVPQLRSIPDSAAMLGYLRSQVFLEYEPWIAPSEIESFRARCVARTEELRRADGSYELDYVRLDMLATA